MQRIHAKGFQRAFHHHALHHSVRMSVLTVLVLAANAVSRITTSRLLVSRAGAIRRQLCSSLGFYLTALSALHITPQTGLAAAWASPCGSARNSHMLAFGAPERGMRSSEYRGTTVHPIPHSRDTTWNSPRRSATDSHQPVERKPAWLNNATLQSDIFGEAIRARRLYSTMKRSFDLALCMVVSLFVLPLFPLIALAIKLDSPGPVFYSQDRVGHCGRIFRIHKFRSMCADAERNGAVWAQESDPRVTRLGRFMRLSRIDELPQLLNVFRGDMTFVGPRPERPEFTGILELAFPDYSKRFSVKPGLTGWAQIRYRYASSVHDSAIKLEYDLYYVQHRSILFDIKVLFLTIPVVVNLRGH